MAKHFVAKHRRFSWATKTYGDEWIDASNRHTDLALYGTARRAITEHWGTDKDESRVRVFLLDTDELEPVTDDLTEQYAHAERMMLKYTERCEELKRRMNEET